ncbi:hypothetical protein HZU77_013230 [Neisseriaceae bacterium TC5R-5]|nr:hypothetical protein [Neisseriaceae bacterium TC5R-5]
MITTTYMILTPHGQFLAEWDEDEDLPVQYRGDPAAIAYLDNYLSLTLACGHGGIRLHLDSLEPDDLIRFCQSEKYGIQVIPDTLAALLDPDELDELDDDTEQEGNPHDHDR